MSGFPVYQDPALRKFAVDDIDDVAGFEKSIGDDPLAWCREARASRAGFAEGDSVAFAACDARVESAAARKLVECARDSAGFAAG